MRGLTVLSVGITCPRTFRKYLLNISLVLTTELRARNPAVNTRSSLSGLEWEAYAVTGDIQDPSGKQEDPDPLQ